MTGGARRVCQCSESPGVGLRLLFVQEKLIASLVTRLPDAQVVTPGTCSG